MKAASTAALPSAIGSSGKGRFSRKRMVASSGAESASVARISAAPKASRFAQRPMLATQSRASTRAPSCQTRPGRSVRSHCLPSSLTTWPSTICGETSSAALMPYNVSNTIAAAVACCEGSITGTPSASSIGLRCWAMPAQPSTSTSAPHCCTRARPAPISRPPTALPALSAALSSTGQLPAWRACTPICRTVRRCRATLAGDSATIPKRSPRVIGRRMPHSAMPITGRPAAASRSAARPGSLKQASTKASASSRSTQRTSGITTLSASR